MTQEKSGFHLRYESAQALQRDHQMKIAKGSLAVGWRSPPPEGTELLLRVESPDGTKFDLDARVAHVASGSGFIANLEPKSVRPLDMFMKSDRFKRALEADKDPRANAPVVTQLGGAPMKTGDLVEHTDPGADESPYSEPTPNDPQGFDLATIAQIAANAELEANTIARELDEGDDDALGADTLGESADLAAGTDAQREPGTGEEGAGVALADQIIPHGMAKPGPGDEFSVYVLKYHTVLDFAAARDDFRETKRMRVEYAEDKAKLGKIAQLRIILPGHNVYRMYGFIEKIDDKGLVLGFDENNEQFRQACLYIDTPAAKGRMKSEESTTQRKPPAIARLLEIVPAEDPDKLPIRRRLQRMGMEDKINMALAGNREERMALAMDGNKAIHHYLLRNAKISLDEIAFMARLPTMNPDVLDKIAENPNYTQNPSVVKALVYNPKTPVPTAIRLLDRLPRQEVLNLAKRSNMNLRLVMAAKKKIEGKRF